MKKSFLRLSLLAIAVCSLFSCKQVRKDVVVLFDNDVHCALNAYKQMAFLRDSALLRTPYVSVVSAGDFAQGDVTGSISHGEYIVDVMNSVPYDVITIGNHEFDYGLPQQHALIQRLNAQTVCCNFSDIDGHYLYEPYTIKEYGPVKVAFIGAATPLSYTSSTPSFFQDSLGNLIYDFHVDDTFSLIQHAADEARSKGADYVIVLCHLGDDSVIDASPDMVSSTRGIDAVLDGHSHHFIHSRLPNLDGDSVLLLSTGSHGEHIGELDLKADGSINVKFHKGRDVRCERVETVIDAVNRQVQATVSRVVGYSQLQLSDSDSNGERLVRNGETLLADFVADAMKYMADAQIGIIHGGGLRASLPQGDITVGDIIKLMPFNNRLAKVMMTGQQILDAFEVAVEQYPVENGDFHIASGLRYEIDPTIQPSVIWDNNRVFLGIGNTRRITKMEVQDPLTKKWIPIDKNAFYTIGGLDYTLLHQGAAWMFRYAKPLPCQDLLDVEVVMGYLHAIGDTIRQDNYRADQMPARFKVKNKR